MPKCCPLFLAVGSKSGCVEEGGSSLSVLACSFRDKPASQAGVGRKSRTDGGARRGENSCFYPMTEPLPPPPPRNRGWAASSHRYAGWSSVFKTKGFPGWGWCFPWPKECTQPCFSQHEGEVRRTAGAAGCCSSEFTACC